MLHTKLLFKLGGLLKILFILNIFLIDKYENILFKKNEASLTNTLLQNLFEKMHFLENLEFNFPWYLYFIAVTFIISYFINFVVINLFAFKPCWKFSQYFHRLSLSRFIYFTEIMLGISLLFIGYGKFKDTFSQKDYGIWEKLLKPLINLDESRNMHLIDKLTTLNLILPFLASLIILFTFWNIRKLNRLKCLES